MNEIKVMRMVLAGLAMFVVWVAVEILVEHVIAQVLFGRTSAEMWQEVIDFNDWSALNVTVSSAIAVLNCMILIWLYASLRPMYGVGTKTALITCAFVIAWIFSMFLNFNNLGLIPLRVSLFEAVFEVIEVPIAMIVGAEIYEGKKGEVQETA